MSATAATDAYFKGTASSVGGIRQEVAADARPAIIRPLEDNRPPSRSKISAYTAYRRDGERHAWNPETISAPPTGNPFG